MGLSTRASPPPAPPDPAPALLALAGGSAIRATPYGYRIESPAGACLVYRTASGFALVAPGAPTRLVRRAPDGSLRLVR